MFPRSHTNITKTHSATLPGTRKPSLMFVFRNLATLILALACLMVATPTWAQEEQYDHVMINGKNLNAIEVFFLEGIIGQDIPNGNYWFEVDSGLWGHVGQPAEGRLDLSPEHKQYVVRNMSPESEPTAANPTAVNMHADCDQNCMYW